MGLLAPGFSHDHSMRTDFSVYLHAQSTHIGDQLCLKLSSTHLSAVSELGLLHDLTAFFCCHSPSFAFRWLAWPGNWSQCTVLQNCCQCAVHWAAGWLHCPEAFHSVAVLLSLPHHRCSRELVASRDTSFQSCFLT